MLFRVQATVHLAVADGEVATAFQAVRPKRRGLPLII